MAPKIDSAVMPGGTSRKDTLRVLTCGSVDDGKSSLIGRLLFDSKTVFQDQLAALADASKQYGTRGGGLDYALILDGLQAEREQAITIDVAYRFFATAHRRYILADAPGHEQYTRNMATGASTAQLAIVLIDARKGVLTQTRRHTRILEMMGVKHLVLAINKMDLVGFDQAIFDEVAGAFRQFARTLNFTQVQAIPLCAVDGDNVIASSTRMPWYTGPALLQHMETVDVGGGQASERFRMPVQWVNRPTLDFRGFCGRIAQGSVRTGEAVRVLPSGRQTRIDQIKVGFDTVAEAVAGNAVTLVLADEVDVSRGDVIAGTEEPPEIADQFEARLLWMGEHPMVPGRPYLLKLHCKEVTASVTAIKHHVDVNSGEHLSAKTLGLNEIAVVNVSTSQPVVFEPYTRNRGLGSFILMDKADFHTVGAGMIDFSLRRSSNIHWQALEIDNQARAALMRQAPLCIWFTGLSGSGKSTLANALEKRLHAEGRFTFILDGDNVRHGLNRDLGFTEADRVENIRRVAHVARLMVDAGLIVMVSFISPFRAERRMARELFPEGRFVEVFVDTPLGECERRDAKGLYGKARRGELKNFTGIDSPYETPESAEIHLHPGSADVEACVEEIVRWLGSLPAR